MKKQISILGAFALAFVASVASAQFASRAQVYDWIKFHLAPQVSTEFMGVTASGKTCGLFLTDQSRGGTQDYYVVVGYKPTLDWNDYIGLRLSQGQVAGVGGIYLFSSDTSWGNDSHFNKVSILTNAQGKPTRVIGSSDLRDIDCQLK